MFFSALHAWPPSNRPPGTGNGSHHDVLELPRRGSFVRQPAVLSTSYRRVLEASQFKANPIVVMMLLLRKSGLQIQTGTNLEHQCCVSLCIAVYRCGTSSLRILSVPLLRVHWAADRRRQRQVLQQRLPAPSSL